MNEEFSSSWIWEHVNELRKRLFYALIGLIVCVLGSFAFTEQIIQFMTRPVGGLDALQAIEVTENVSVYMKTALLSGFIISLPWILFQLLKFILPGLKEKEKKWLFSAIPLASLLFVGGVAFAFFVMLTPAIQVMTEFLDITTTLRVKSYMDFVTNLLFWMGVIFEFPLIFFVLAKLKIVNAKGLLKGWRIAVVLIAVLAAMITPTVDPVNMALFMIPLFILYLLSILLAAIAGKNRSYTTEGD
jgi:sec-independent protein translocase protein TatC